MKKTTVVDLAPRNRAEFMALLEALSQYVENEREHVELYEADPVNLSAAEAMLERLETIVAAQAEG